MANRHPDLKRLYYEMIGLLFSYLSWAQGIGIANSRSWRVWELDSKIYPIVFFGLWDAFYLKVVNVSGSMHELPRYLIIDESWVISNEIYYGQGLILLANFIKSAALVFCSLAFFVTYINGPYREFRRMYYNISASLLFFSSGCTLLTVIWNFTAEFYGQSTFDFPPNFPVGIEMVKQKRMSYVFPVGITTSVLSLISAIVFSCDISLLRQWVQVMPMPAVTISKQKA